MRIFKSFQDFANEVGKDEKLAGEIAADPYEALQKVRNLGTQNYRL